MASQPDQARSEKARADGNAAFKKGRWTEAIGHYTTAIVHYPTDPLAYNNRAAAYLRLEKFDDALRDTTSALERDSKSVKALYRHALALKGLERHDEALRDLEQVLKLEPGNETAKDELEDISELRDAQLAVAERKRASRQQLPPSPPRPTASIEPIDDDDDNASAAPLHPAPHATIEGDTTAGPSQPSSSFAFLRSKRRTERDKKTYISTASAPSANGGNVSAATCGGSPSSPAAASSSATDVQSTTKAVSMPPSTTSEAAVSVSTLPDLPSDPSPAQILLRLGSTSSPQSTWHLLSAIPPATFLKRVHSLLEPDTLGAILLGLRHGLEADQAAEHAQRIRELLVRLKGTARYGMNVAMLSSSERNAGQEAWRACGGEGSWP